MFFPPKQCIEWINKYRTFCYKCLYNNVYYLQQGRKYCLNKGVFSNVFKDKYLLETYILILHIYSRSYVCVLTPLQLVTNFAVYYVYWRNKTLKKELKISWQLMVLEKKRVKLSNNKIKKQKKSCQNLESNPGPKIVVKCIY